MRFETNIETGITTRYPDELVTPYIPTAEEKRALLPALSPAQLRLALDQLGLLDKAQAVVDAGDKKLKIGWEFETELPRDKPIINDIADALGLTDEQLDNVFTIGATL